MIITEIKKDKKQKSIIVTTSEGCFSINADVYFDSRIYKGMEITQKQIDLLTEQSGKKEALNKAMAYISRKTCTKKMMSDYLYKKGFNKSAVEQTLEKLTDYKYINDEEYTKTYICGSVGKGKLKLAYELKMRGIDESIINKYTLSPEDEFEQCVRQGKKFLGNKDIDDIKTKQKLYRHLISKGFEYGTIENALNSIKNEDK